MAQNQVVNAKTVNKQDLPANVSSKEIETIKSNVNQSVQGAKHDKVDGSITSITKQ